ncbi:MAG: hypothetical protein KDK70_44565, partial [Myxococcales bacterium]|nr:hypothetical protein [Myxococcales bacterium]
VLTALLIGNVVGAQEPTEANVRYTRKAKKASAKSGLLKTEFEAKKREFDDQRARTDAVGEAQDPFAKQVHAVSLEMLDKQIEMLEKLIKTTDPNDPEYPDYLFRLADHHLEKKSYYELQAGSLYDKIYDAKSGPKADKKAAEALLAKQRRFQDEAKDASERATRVYAALVDDPQFASYKR